MTDGRVASGVQGLIDGFDMLFDSLIVLRAERKCHRLPSLLSLASILDDQLAALVEDRLERPAQAA